MAGVSTKEIKNRIRSMESTRQITKAMEMVAASKLRHAQARVTAVRPYFEIFHDTIQEIVANDQDFSSPYLQERTGNRSLYIVIAGDRGLAGGFNSNILKLCLSEMEGKDATVLPLGKKAVDFFRQHNVPILTDQYSLAGEIHVGDCFSISKMLCTAYLAGDYDEIVVGYTNFISVLSQTPATMRLLPLSKEAGESSGSQSLTSFEPSSEEVFAAIVPEYLGGILYGALSESQASEQAARRTAMDSATQNAEELIADLSLKFNRARQSAITNEIIDIVSGANA